LAAAVVAQAMVSTFGRGLLVPGTSPTVAAGLATALGAGTWVFVATRTGLPVSTTHALVGSLVGAASVAHGPASVQWDAMLTTIALPLLLSPLLAVIAAAALGRLSPWRDEPETVPDCICAGVAEAVVSGGAGAVRTMGLAPRPYVVVETAAVCASDHSQAAALTVDRVHWLTRGAVSFARGLNDAPKLAVLLLATGASLELRAGALPAFGVIAAGMTVGSLTGGWRVTRLLAEDVTPMDRHGSFVANAVTALLVGAGAYTGLPMSTTHVSSGGIIGLGMASGADTVRWATVRRMLAGWVITLPVAAMLGALGVLWLRRLVG
jgi:PiT family inorganic phosphate transporter